MIRIQKISNGGIVQPQRQLTSAESPTVIAVWGDATDYIYFQSGDESSNEWIAYQTALNYQPTAAELTANQISRYASVAPGLLDSINRLNSDAGVTTANGDQIERDYEEVTRAIERGYFGLALYRLSVLPNVGITYEGQDLKAQWTSLITTCKNNNQL